MVKELNLFSLVKPIINESADEKIPDRVNLKANQMWCPYCSSPVVFVKANSLGVKKCPACGISERDYYVKRLNSKWK